MEVRRFHTPHREEGRRSEGKKDRWKCATSMRHTEKKEKGYTTKIRGNMLGKGGRERW